jgi:hypothetical protein
MLIQPMQLLSHLPLMLLHLPQMLPYLLRIIFR